MKTFSNIATESQLIYKAGTTYSPIKTWSLKKTTCDVLMYEDVSPSDLDTVICSTVCYNGGTLSILELATILGFNVFDNQDSTPKRYKDEAELELFNNLIKPVEDDELIRIIDGTVILTELGSLVVNDNKKRFYYAATCRFLENFGLKNSETFPFREELSIVTHIENKRRINYYSSICKCYSIDPVVLNDEESLVSSLLLQLDTGVNVFSARLKENDFIIGSEQLIVSVHNHLNKDLVIVYSKSGEISELTSSIINSEENTELCSRKIEWGYYLRLLEDPTANLNYKTLFQFKDIIVWSEIINDKRFCWEDSDLIGLMTKDSDANLWKDISALCPTEQIKEYLQTINSNWDWNILSIRIDLDFIIENAIRYPWNYDLVINNASATTDKIETLLLLPELASVRWQWKEIMPKLHESYILNHIKDIDFDLSDWSRENVELACKYIISYPDKSWDWGYVSDKFDLKYILDNISIFAKRLDLRRLIIRIFQSKDAIEAYCKSVEFRNELCRVIETSGLYINVNELNLIWNYDSIDYLEELGFLSWCSIVPSGFENNPYICWDEEFFNRYSSKITNESGYNCVSSRIENSIIIDHNPSFLWNWDVISSNPALINDAGFAQRHIDKIKIDKAFACFTSETFCSLFSDSYIQEYLDSHPEKMSDATYLASIQLVRNNIDYPWDWTILTARTISCLKIDRLGDPKWIDKWDWDYLSQELSTDNICKYLDDYIDRWNWNTLTRKIDKEFILCNLVEYASYWDWSYILKDILSKDDLRLDGNLLPRIATIISVKDEESQSQLWNIITRKFDNEELFELIHKTSKLTEYSDLFKWDIQYLYDNKNFDLDGYVKKYSEDVDWSLLSSSKSAERLFQYDKDLFGKELWIKTIKKMLLDAKYHWDFIALSRNDSINWNPAILKTKKTQWDWNYLSENSKCFSNNAGSRIVDNIGQFKKFLNFDILSHRTDLNFDDELLKKFIFEEWNWNFISSSEKLVVSNSFIINNKDKDWNWNALSRRKNAKIDIQLLKNTKEKPWDWQALSSNSMFTCSLCDLLSLEIFKWDWAAISGRLDVEFDNNSLLNTIDQSVITWDWAKISHRNDLSFDENFIMKTYNLPLDWYAVSGSINFVPSINILSKLSVNVLDWNAISKNPHLSKDILWPYREKLNWTLVCNSAIIKEFDIDSLRKYKDYLDWNIISGSEIFEPTSKNLIEFKQELNWCIINNRKDIIYSNELIEELPEYIDWVNASRSNNVVFSVDFVKRFAGKWDWKELFDNPHIVEQQDIYLNAFKDKANGVKFLKRFKTENPKVYHFAHLFNAINIIKGRKVLSRIKGQGLFENSAGSNVHRRDTAHHYARFYYRPQTPTQYYNESLGEDSKTERMRSFVIGYDAYGKEQWDSRLECPTTKYYNAQKLGSPKCPMPVFFEFDLQEILRTQLDKCYYSTGNMQMDSSELISIKENPNRLNTEALYSTIKKDGLNNYKAYSQQEFLVLDELDFASLNNFRIICFNEQQEAILKEQLADDSICSHITLDDRTNTGIDVFYRENRNISVDITDETITIDTDYRDSSEIRIISNKVNEIELIDKEHVTKVTNDTISAYPSISFKKTGVPLTVKFVDLEKYYANSWIIYSNETLSNSLSKRYGILNEERILSFIKAANEIKIPISKELFKSNMLYSYHGISHTVRVMWNAYMIAILDKDFDNELISPLLHAALIHDLGKTSDIEGESHGNRSASLYKSLIEKIFNTGQISSKILDAVKYHSVDDSRCPNETQQNPIWQILKDADSLDRSRLPGKGCNPSFLRNNIFRTSEGKELYSLAQTLPSMTETCAWDNPIEEFKSIIIDLI